MCLLKIHNNVLLSRVSNNANTLVFGLAKLNESTKHMLKVGKEMLVKGKSSKFKLKQQST